MQWHPVRAKRIRSSVPAFLMSDHVRRGAGLTAGQLQRMQADMAKWAALAGAMAGAAHWDDMETLLSMLAQQAAAGARADLLPLMQVGDGRSKSYHETAFKCAERSYTTVYGICI